MLVYSKNFLRLSFLLGLSQGASASGSTEAGDLQAASPWTLQATVRTLSSVASPAESDYSLKLSGRLLSSYQLASGQSLSLDVLGTKELNQDQLWVLSRTNLSYEREFLLDANRKLRTGLSWDFAVNKEDLRYDDALGGLDLQLGGEQSWQLAEHRLRLSVDLSWQRLFYRFTSDEGGNPLARDIFTQSYGLLYVLPAKVWSLGFSYSNSSARDFQAKRMDDQYSHSETVYYSWSQRLGLFAGHTNNGNTFDYNGVAGNVRPYDPYTSLVFLGGSYGFL